MCRANEGKTSAEELILAQPQRANECSSGGIASGRLDVKPFISRSFAFADGIKAFEEAASGNPTDIKVQIVLE